MKLFLSGFSRALGAVGMLLLGAVLVFDHRWTGSWVGTILVFSATILLRAYQVPLTKYGALNFLAFPAIAGAIINGASSTVLGIYAGVFVTDLLILRKSTEPSWINAGREVLALLSADGFFAFASVATGASHAAGMTTDGLPALTLFALAYFILSRSLLYFSLLWRDKLLEEE